MGYTRKHPMNSDLIVELGRLRRPPSFTIEIETFESRQSIIASLIKMRQAGIFRGVWCDDNQLQVSLPSADVYPVRDRITWIQALAMVEEFNRQSATIRPVNVERKPPARSELPKEAKTKWVK
jgi:hypothetical protein